MAAPGKLTPTEALYERRAAGESLAVLGADFGVSRQALSVHFKGPGREALQVARLERERALIEALPKPKRRSPSLPEGPPKPADPEPEWDREGGESYSAYCERQARAGNGARVGRVIQW